jgi:branched-subunit amino acid ABC-type transport system permease component
VLLLAALGLAITFGLMGIINMAHGELLMIGAYTTYVCQSLFRHFSRKRLTLIYCWPCQQRFCLGNGRYRAGAHGDSLALWPSLGNPAFAPGVSA